MSDGSETRCGCDCDCECEYDFGLCCFRFMCLSKDKGRSEVKRVELLRIEIILLNEIG